MSALVILEWTFKPPDYFEEPIEIVYRDHTLTITRGKAEAKLDPVLFDANPAISRTLHDQLNDMFIGVEVVTHRPYQISRPATKRLCPDGRQGVFLIVEPARVTMTANPDVQVRDKNGNIIADSRRERIEKKKTLAELVRRYRLQDETLAVLLRSYDAAVRDPDNELVYLYEIPEALSTKFGGETAVRSELGISSADWSAFGRLCNKEPIRQGRHRGKSGLALRDATPSELNEARRIARTMIEAYLSYFHKHGGKSSS
ncbi:MAG: hypothetical protein Kow00109_14570 [Acidobacteriota bacterium]